MSAHKKNLTLGVQCYVDCTRREDNSDSETA